MKQIIPHLYVCGLADYEALGPAILRYSVLGACKEPLHRKFARIQGATEDGYDTVAMPKYEKEYLYAERSHALYLNMVDARDPRFFSKDMFYKALDFINTERNDGRDVLIVCNKGESRSPSVAFLYLLEKGCFDGIDDFEEAIEKFKSEYYPQYKPGIGIYVAIRDYWRSK